MVVARQGLRARRRAAAARATGRRDGLGLVRLKVDAAPRPTSQPRLGDARVGLGDARGWRRRRPPSTSWGQGVARRDGAARGWSARRRAVEEPLLAATQSAAPPWPGPVARRVPRSSLSSRRGSAAPSRAVPSRPAQPIQPEPSRQRAAGQAATSRDVSGQVTMCRGARATGRRRGGEGCRHQVLRLALSAWASVR